jgi:hypothetical protein
VTEKNSADVYHRVVGKLCRKWPSEAVKKVRVPRVVVKIYYFNLKFIWFRTIDIVNQWDTFLLDRSEFSNRRQII